RCGDELDHGVAAVTYGSRKGMDYFIRRDEFVDCARTGWNRKIRPEYGFDDEDYEDEHKEEEEEDRTWIFYLGGVLSEWRTYTCVFVDLEGLSRGSLYTWDYCIYEHSA
ncbi:hypothetical protein HID58_027917, partial [Brassica napus]